MQDMPQRHLHVISGALRYSGYNLKTCNLPGSQKNTWRIRKWRLGIPLETEDSDVLRQQLQRRWRTVTLMNYGVFSSLH